MTANPRYHRYTRLVLRLQDIGCCALGAFVPFHFPQELGTTEAVLFINLKLHYLYRSPFTGSRTCLFENPQCKIPLEK